MARRAKTDQATQSRREDILVIAARVIAERGIAGATVREIGDAAGIMSGSLYHHFSSKEQIVLELLLPSVEAHHHRCVALVARQDPALQTLEELIRISVEQVVEHPNQSIILRNEAFTFRNVPALAPLAEVRLQSLELWTELLRRGIATGEFRQDIDADVAVHALIDALLGVSRSFNSDDGATSQAVADTLVHLYVEGLRQR